MLAAAVGVGLGRNGEFSRIDVANPQIELGPKCQATNGETQGQDVLDVALRTVGCRHPPRLAVDVDVCRCRKFRVCPPVEQLPRGLAG